MLLRSALGHPGLLLVACACALPARAAGPGDYGSSSSHDEPAMCQQMDYGLPPLPDAADPRLIVNADQTVLNQDGPSQLTGRVHLMQGGREFLAPALDYDENEHQLHISQESLFRNQSIILKSQKLDFDLNSESGTFSDNQFTLPQRAARGDASTVTLDKDGTAKLQKVRYTTCAPGNDSWYINASDIKLDHDEGLGTAHNATLDFQGVPILYMPYFQFPIDDQRRTGLLYPTIGQSNRNGFDMRWPVYLNWAPNYDTTLQPRLMTERGLQLGSQSRYLFEDSQGNLRYDFLNHDASTGTQRSFFQWDHNSLINQRLSLESHLARASDKNYFEDLGGAPDAASTNFLDRSALLTYQAPSAYVITALAQDYQTISTSVLPPDEPYARLPQVQFKVRTKNSLANTRLGLFSEYTNFQRANTSQNPEGQRLYLDPYLLTEIERNTWYFNSQADFNYTYYALNDTLPGAPTSPQRRLPQLSAGAGLRFERLTDFGMLQTLEPQAYYLFTPYRDQSTLPLFDSGEPDFDFTQLFARNRYSGEDRIADANQLALAATTRLLDPESGVQRLSASIGQMFRFTAPQVPLPGALGAPPEKGVTDLLAGLDYRMSPYWSASLASQWSPDDSKFSRNSVALRYARDSTLVSFGYRYRAQILEEADLTASLPLGSSWHLAARTRYSLKENSDLDSLLGIEYSTCCWAVQTSYRRFIANARGEFDNGIYLQLNLKGLTKLGTGYTTIQSLEPQPEVLTAR